MASRKPFAAHTDTFDGDYLLARESRNWLHFPIAGNDRQDGLPMPRRHCKTRLDLTEIPHHACVKTLIAGNPNVSMAIDGRGWHGVSDDVSQIDSASITLEKSN